MCRKPRRQIRSMHGLHPLTTVWPEGHPTLPHRIIRISCSVPDVTVKRWMTGYPTTFRIVQRRDPPLPRSRPGTLADTDIRCRSAHREITIDTATHRASTPPQKPNPPYQCSGGISVVVPVALGSLSGSISSGDICSGQKS